MENLNRALKKGYAHKLNGWQGFFEAKHVNRYGETVWEDDFIQNTLANEGEENILKTYLQNLSAPSTFYLRLYNDTPVETDSLGDLTGEPSGNGYAAQELTRNGTGWPTVALIFGSGSDESGTAQAGAASTITLAVAANGTDDYYKYATIKITGGTGAGQKRVIESYVGSTKVATVSENWTVTPDATSTYTIYADYIATSAVATFSASGNWTAVTYVVQSTTSDDSGLLISFAPLSQTRTLQTGESLQITYRVKLS